MARRPFVAGNWKMNLDRAGAKSLAGAIAAGLPASATAEAAVFPPNVYIDAVVEAARGGRLGVGAQNLYHEPKGAFTGECSAAMLRDLGCGYVILGHSERRHILGETDAAINRKVRAALAAGLTPIVCVGELLAQREDGQTADIVASQFAGSLAGLSGDDFGRVVLAYEPVWAIGTGKVATPDQAEEVHRDLRKQVERRYNAEIAAAVRIQYGGSVNPKNAAELLAQPNIDGLLVGGASLKADDFLGILAAAK